MRELFSATGDRPKDRFHRWHEFCDERLFPMTQRQLADDAFSASAEGCDVGKLAITKMSVSCLGVETTSKTMKDQDNKSDNVFISLILSGAVKVDSNGLSSLDRAADFGIRDQNTPWRLEYADRTELLAIEIPRRPLEGLLGPVKTFSGLNVSGDLPSATLARSFLCDLVRVGDRLAPDVAERMATVATDLIAASIAERMALDVPKPLHATITVQHAKAYIRAHLSDPDLNSARVAAALRVSVRFLQEHFRQSGHNIASWIWSQRLEMAAQRLADPAFAHQPLGTLAYGCGFSDQAHFSRRFRDSYGMSPREYRHREAVDASARNGRG